MGFFGTALSWTWRQLLSFALIVTLLTLGLVFRPEIERIWNQRKDHAALPALRGEQADLLRLRTEAAALARTATADLHDHAIAIRKMPQALLLRRRSQLDADIAEAERDMPDAPSALRMTIAPNDYAAAYLDHARARVRLDMLRKERELVDAAVAVRTGNAASEAKIAQMRHSVARLDTRLSELKRLRAANQAEQDRILRGRFARGAIVGPVVTWAQGLPDLRTRAQALDARIEDATRDKQLLESQIAVAEGALAALAQAGDSVRYADAALDQRIAAISARIAGGEAFTRVRESARKAVWIAIGILFLTILAPIGTKAILYYLIAPLAERRPPIRILPEASGLVDIAGQPGPSPGRLAISAVSQEISPAADEELLILPDYLQSSAQAGRADTLWLLDWKSPVTSILSGMVGLIRIRAETGERFVVSATRDPFSEIGLVSIPAGSAMILQPHNLVGLVQRRNQPVRISRHWRFGLTAWLTLQLRYLAFHGPATLIVMGCRGVRLEPSDSGRSINQAATIGFSANLAYSTSRCETFGAYLMGKKELFNDNFSGGPGWYLYEEMPHFGKKTGIMGRGLEGIIDSIRQVFGV